MPQRGPQDLFAHVVDAYWDSDKFAKLKLHTRRTYKRFLVLASRLDGLGSVPAAQMRPSLVQAFLDGLADRPAAQQKAKVVMRAIERWAVVRDLLPPSGITRGLEAPGSDGGHQPWPEESVSFAEANCVPHVSRAVSLAAGTGQRGGDLIRMRWTDIEVIGRHPGINVRQQKTGVRLWIPFTEELISKFATWQRHPGFILLKADGTPYANRQQLTDKWDREKRKPHLQALQGLTLHGLRATAVVRLRRAGCSLPEICSMVGMSAQMVERYCRYSIQKENALAAVARLDSSQRIRK